MKTILQKLIAASGYCSRRQAEKLVQEGKVTLNGRTAVPGDMADPETDKITVKGKALSAPAEKIYLKLNKPAGYTCTNRRFVGEKNIFDLVRVSERLFSVGRLDKESRGLVLLTNDGELAQKLAHPRFEHEKIYEVRVSGQIKNPASIISSLQNGVELGEGDGLGRAKKASLREILNPIKTQTGEHLQKAIFIITLSEGKKRQLRRMFQTLSLRVQDIRRINLAGLELGELPEGQWIELSPSEIEKLRYERPAVSRPGRAERPGGHGSRRHHQFGQEKRLTGARRK